MSLNSTLCNALFRSIDLLRALAMSTIMVVVMGAIMYAMAKGVSFIFHLFCTCS